MPHDLRLLAAQVRHPHAGVGLTLLVLAAVTAGFAVLLVRLKRTSSLLSELAALTAVLLVAGLVLVTRTQTCPAFGCGAPAALPVVTPPPSAAPVAHEALPSPVTIATVPATRTPAAARATRSATPVAPAASRPGAPAATPTRPAPRPSAAPTFTATVIRPVSCSSSRGGSVDRVAVVLLRNSATAPLTWHGTARETLAGRAAPWAVLDPTGTTIPAGGTVNVGVSPDASLCRNGGPEVVRHVDLRYGRATLAVELTVSPQP